MIHTIIMSHCLNFIQFKPWLTSSISHAPEHFVCWALGPCKVLYLPANKTLHYDPHKLWSWYKFTLKTKEIFKMPIFFFISPNSSNPIRSSNSSIFGIQSRWNITTWFYVYETSEPVHNIFHIMIQIYILSAIWIIKET